MSVSKSSKQSRVGAVLVLVEFQMKEKRCVHTRGNNIIMHSRTVMDKEETSVNSSWCSVSHLQIDEKRCAHKEICMMHSLPVMDKGEASV